MTGHPLCFNPSVLLLGHRGACRYAPENTLAAFDLAMAHGCDGFEFDVRATADGAAIVCHDPRVGRLAVASNSYAQLLKRRSSLPTLDQVLSRFAARAYLYIEVKVPGLDNALLSALAAHPPQRGWVAASFFPEIISSVRGRNAGVPLGFICDDRRRLPRWRRLPVNVVMPQHRLVTRALVEELHAAGKQVFVWTVNQEREMLSLAALGVDGIVSDDTQLLGHTFGRL